MQNNPTISLFNFQAGVEFIRQVILSTEKSIKKICTRSTVLHNEDQYKYLEVEFKDITLLCLLVNEICASCAIFADSVTPISTFIEFCDQKYEKISQFCWETKDMNIKLMQENGSYCFFFTCEV